MGNAGRSGLSKRTDLVFDRLRLTFPLCHGELVEPLVNMHGVKSSTGSD